MSLLISNSFADRYEYWSLLIYDFVISLSYHIVINVNIISVHFIISQHGCVCVCTERILRICVRHSFPLSLLCLFCLPLVVACQVHPVCWRENQHLLSLLLLSYKFLTDESRRWINPDYKNLLLVVSCSHINTCRRKRSDLSMTATQTIWALCNKYETRLKQNYVYTKLPKKIYIFLSILIILSIYKLYFSR